MNVLNLFFICLVTVFSCLEANRMHPVLFRIQNNLKNKKNYKKNGKCCGRRVHYTLSNEHQRRCVKKEDLIATVSLVDSVFCTDEEALRAPFDGTLIRKGPDGIFKCCEAPFDFVRTDGNCGGGDATIYDDGGNCLPSPSGAITPIARDKENEFYESSIKFISKREYEGTWGYDEADGSDSGDGGGDDGGD